MQELVECMNVINSLRTESSSKAKENILTGNINNELLKSILNFVYNPYILTGISKSRIIDIQLTKDIVKMLPPNIPENIVELIDYIKNNNTGRNVDLYICKQSIILISSQSESKEEMQEFLYDIISKSLKTGCTAKTLNKIYGLDFIPLWEVQQGYPVDKAKLKGDEYISISQKLNGIRGTYIDSKIISRQGIEIEGLEHIISDIKKILQLYLCNNNYVIDGELIRNNVHNTLSDNDNFRLTTSVVNGNNNKEEIQFIIFDILHKEWFLDYNFCPNYSERRKILEKLQNFIKDNDIKNIAVVPLLYEGFDHSNISKYLKQMDSEGKEGCMVNLDVPYYRKRHKGILKVKTFKTCDLQIVGYEEGNGLFSGKLGSIVVDLNGNNVNVGTGLTEEQRNFYWKYRDSLIGKIAEVKYKEVSKDKTGKESLQFPIFVCIREEGKEISMN